MITPHRSRVLVVDDEPGNVALVAAVLRQEHAVSVAIDGERALELVGRERPDLVLLDVEMPGLDGYEVCRALKASPRTAQLPVIFLTSRSSVSDEAYGFEVGAVDYIHKPLSPPLLRARVRTQLSLREALEESRREKAKADELLEVVLPKPAAQELRATSTVRPRRIEEAAVGFADVVGFTAFCDRTAPEEVVRLLHALFLRFEELSREHGVEKLKSVGDGFMCGAGLLVPRDQPLSRVVRAGLAMTRAVSEVVPEWRLRVGANLGPVVSGIVGGERYQFDVWGDTVNVAARLAGAGTPGSVVVKAEHLPLLEGGVQGRPLGPRLLKGKGEVELYEVTALD